MIFGLTLPRDMVSIRVENGCNGQGIRHCIRTQTVELYPTRWCRTIYEQPRWVKSGKFDFDTVCMFKGHLTVNRYASIETLPYNKIINLSIHKHTHTHTHTCFCLILTPPATISNIFLKLILSLGIMFIQSYSNYEECLYSR